MDDLELRLRGSLAHQVQSAPALPDLSSTVVRRGRRARRRQRLTTGAVALLVLGGAALLVLERTPGLQSLQPAGGGPGSEQEVAPNGWMDGFGLGSTSDRPLPLGVGARALFPAATGYTTGLSGAVLDVQRAGAEVVFVVDDGAGGTPLGVLSPDGTQRTLADDVNPGVAVSPDGTRLAYAEADTGRLRIVDVATGTVVTQTETEGRVTPGGWVGDEVLLSVRRNGSEQVRAWDTTSTAVRDVGVPGRYAQVLGVAAGSDLVALTRTVDGCVTVSHLAQDEDLWVDCGRTFVGFSPAAGSALLRSSAGYVVRAALTGDLLGSPRLPSTGLVVAALTDDDSVLAAVRTRLGTGERDVFVVSCPVTEEQTCLVVQSGAGDATSGWAAGARY